MIGYRPSGVVAGCLYLAAERAGFCLSQRRIADIAGTLPNTLRSCRDELLEVVTPVVEGVLSLIVTSIITCVLECSDK
ncbi:hypothetical protein [Natrinema sp. SYSU A 869]|uniref:hypothetical protein n=1 Tax=Natrinema sp. SYSU A 869 TaxID=2871694 RepID=UPI002107477E|nr:hypothetical protein [Natrinema sp. SYSU A 869]